MASVYIWLAVHAAFVLTVIVLVTILDAIEGREAEAAAVGAAALALAVAAFIVRRLLVRGKAAELATNGATAAHKDVPGRFFAPELALSNAEAYRLLSRLRDIQTDLDVTRSGLREYAAPGSPATFEHESGASIPALASSGPRR